MGNLRVTFHRDMAPPPRLYAVLFTYPCFRQSRAPATNGISLHNVFSPRKVKLFLKRVTAPSYNHTLYLDTVLCSAYLLCSFMFQAEAELAACKTHTELHCTAGQISGRPRAPRLPAPLSAARTVAHCASGFQRKTRMCVSESPPCLAFAAVNPNSHGVPRRSVAFESRSHASKRNMLLCGYQTLQSNILVDPRSEPNCYQIQKFLTQQKSENIKHGCFNISHISRIQKGTSV